MSDLTEFLAARLDEDERAALAVAGSGGWSAYIEGGDGWAIQDEAQGDPGTIIGDGAMTRHIARHDPKRVMAEVEAKRRIVAIHVPVTQYGQEYCQGCGVADGDEYYMPVDECPERRALAAVYAYHPDYQPEWIAS